MKSPIRRNHNLGKLATTPGREIGTSIRKKNQPSLEAREMPRKVAIETPANPNTTPLKELFEAIISAKLKGSHNPGNEMS